MPNDIPEEKHHHEKLEFPEGFLWGASTSSYQVEGENSNTDWWEWERKSPNIQNSELAADQYNKYSEDFALAKSLGHNAHRLSIEWARIEPEEGVFSEEALEHYQLVLKNLKDQGISVMLTIHHFTNPLWFSKRGGWEDSKAPFYFERLVKKVVPYLKDYVDLWVTINEPSVYAFCSYTIGVWPPQVKSKWRAFWVFWHMIAAHKKAYKVIHKLIPNAKVGVAHNISSFSQFHKHSIREGLAVWVADVINNHSLYIFSSKKYHDFLGLNYYFNRYISFNGESKLPQVVDINVTKKDVSDMGWEIRPEGIFDAMMDFSDYHLPIYITENGLASTNDDRRCRFLISYLKEIYHAISSGANIRGYFHWSLIDNFEWADGYNPRFGLIEIDFKTQRRTPRPSAYVYREIIRNNGIPHDLLIFQGHNIKAKDVVSLE
jgi:beta-glucosidase